MRVFKSASDWFILARRRFSISGLLACTNRIQTKLQLKNNETI